MIGFCILFLPAKPKTLLEPTEGRVRPFIAVPVIQEGQTAGGGLFHFPVPLWYRFFEFATARSPPQWRLAPAESAHPAAPGCPSASPAWLGRGAPGRGLLGGGAREPRILRHKKGLPRRKSALKERGESQKCHRSGDKAPRESHNPDKAQSESIKSGGGPSLDVPGPSLCSCFEKSP